MQAKVDAETEGAAILPCSCRPVAFTLIAPEAKQVYVAGSFNDWDGDCTPLSKGIDGEWSGYLPLKPGTYEYRFVVDGVWKEDPAALASMPNPFGSINSVVIVREDHAV
jgi:1,4-alpha-glucan branching enzyme